MTTRRVLSSRAVLAAVSTVIASALVVAGVQAKPAGARGLTFGIYPGGAVGTVGPSGPVAPEDPAKRLAALKRLRPAGRPFVLHLYASYVGRAGPSAAQQAGGEVGAYGRAGFQTELALCYRPVDGGSPADVSGFVAFVREAVRALGHTPGFVSVQVTNEANVDGSPNASDGYYKGVQEALVRGVIAAKAQARSDRVRVLVGFNWAFDTGPREHAFWRGLRLHGGRRFVGALDWVGIDAYPGTWGGAVQSGDVMSATRRFMDDALGRLRLADMPLAAIPRSVPLVVAENGYPTGSGRSEATQAEVMEAAIDAVERDRRADNVTGYRWFDLRDADSASASFESAYGILRDDYSPKAAFYTYRALIARLTRR